MGNSEWSKDLVNISVEPILLIERGSLLPSEQGRWRGREVGDSSEISGEDVVDASKLETTNCGVGKDI